MIKKHWSIIYIINRIKLFYYEKSNPKLPWLTPISVKLLNDLIKNTDIGLEFGSGRSTIWFAKRCSFLTSIEHDEKWFEKISKIIKKKGLSNINYLYKRINKNKPLTSEYYNVINNFENNSLDFILVDGAYRDIISLAALNKIKIGGMLILDNSNWFLMHKTKSPASIGLNHDRMDKNWKEFFNKTNTWRYIWTSNGITDTVIFFKR